MASSSREGEGRRTGLGARGSGGKRGRGGRTPGAPLSPGPQLPPFIAATEEGCRVAVKVHPGARRERLVGLVGGHLKLEVTAAPERGAANAAVESLLAALLAVAPPRVAVVSGRASRTKAVAVRGMSAVEAVARLLAAISDRSGR